MPIKTTRTLNPLPFQDLEPHRFEDLIRQLAYELRRWKSLEATGRGGSDDGIDIRGLELVAMETEVEIEEEETEPLFEERLWIFQCKRQKVLTPKDMKTTIDESLKSLTKPPHGFVIAIACDISKKARDAFREEMVARGIHEFFIWAKGELEDMLFQAKNDRLLFAYFGLSLQPRRQSVSAAIRSRIATKKKIAALVDDDGRREELVLLRDPRNQDYPHNPIEKDEKPGWLVCRAVSAKNPDGLAVLQTEHLAALTPDGKWDAILEYNSGKDFMESELSSKNAWSVPERRAWRENPAREFWLEYIPENERATLKVYRWVPYDHILAVDPLGDGYFPIPHIFVEFDEQYGPFMKGKKFHLKSAHNGFQREAEAREDNRTSIFPKPIPKNASEVPKAFDQTIKSTLPLSEQNKDKFKQVIGTFSDRKKASEEKSLEAKAHKPEKNPAVLAFQAWRESVALPTLSALVGRLRKEGHESRVVTNSHNPATASHYSEFLESIEIRIKINHGGSVHNPDYKPSGHLKIGLSQNRGLMIDAAPKEDSGSSSPNRNYGQRPAPTSPTLEQMTKENLESQVLTILERLGSNS